MLTSLTAKNAGVPDLPGKALRGQSSSAPTVSFQARLDEAIRLHKEGNEGNVAAVHEANRLLERLRLEHPEHALAKAYHGAVLNLIARYSTRPLERLKWSRRGLKLLDEAVAAEPSNAKIRLLRGKVAYAVPEKHFQRTHTAIEDYTFLINSSIRKNGALTGDDSRLVYELGEAYYRIGRNQDAADCWRKLENDAVYGQKARERLQLVAGRPAVEKVRSEGGPGLTDFIGAIALATGKGLLRWVKKEEEKARKKRSRRKRKHSR